jgi:hypothetical protein
MRAGKFLFVDAALSALVQNQEVQNNQSTKSSQLAKVPADSNFGVLPEGARVSLLFPVAANGCSCSTGIGADQISGSHGASKVGALGQVLSLLTAGEDAGVSPRCSCRPAGDSVATFQVESKCPAGIDAGNLLHGDLEGSNHVLDYDLVFADLNPGKPKEHQSAKDYGQNQGSAQKHSQDAIGGKDAGQSQRHGTNDDYREVSRGLSCKNLHVTSVAVNEKGLCLNDL